MIANLRLKLDGTLVHLPDWSRFLVSLGSSAAAIGRNSPRLVIGVALPTRSYAAMFTLLGVAAVQIGKSREFDAEYHFRKIQNLPKGTPVAVYNPSHTRKQRGLLDGYEEIGGVPTIFVRTSGAKKHNQRHGLTLPLIHRVELLAPEDHSEQRPFGTQHVTSSEGLLRFMLPETNVQRYITQTQLNTILIGRVGVIKEEVSLTDIFFRSPQGKAAAGTMQDLVRLRIDPHVPYRSYVVSPSPRRSLALSRTASPDVVIFDGATGLLRTRHHWPASHWIVVLERSDPLYSDAIDTINELYLQRSGDARVRGIMNPPAGAESCMFER
jgi:hypothetical protein